MTHPLIVFYCEAPYSQGPNCIIAPFAFLLTGVESNYDNQGEFPDKKLGNFTFWNNNNTCIDKKILKWRFLKKQRVVNSIEN